MRQRQTRMSEEHIMQDWCVHCINHVGEVCAMMVPGGSLKPNVVAGFDKPYALAGGEQFHDGPVINRGSVAAGLTYGC